MARSTRIVVLLAVMASASSAIPQTPEADPGPQTRMFQYFSNVPIGGPSSPSQSATGAPTSGVPIAGAGTPPTSYAFADETGSSEPGQPAAQTPPPARKPAKPGARPKKPGTVQVPPLMEDLSIPRPKASRAAPPTRPLGDKPSLLVPNPADEPTAQPPSRLEQPGPAKSPERRTAPPIPLPSAKPTPAPRKPAAAGKSPAAKVRMPEGPVPEAPLKPQMLPKPRSKSVPDPGYGREPAVPEAPLRGEPLPGELDSDTSWMLEEAGPGVDAGWEAYSPGYQAPSRLGFPDPRVLLRGVKMRGWIDQGVTVNTFSPRDRRNFPVTFNDRSNAYQMNQLYAVMESPVDTDRDRLQVGGRVDLLYGTDHVYTTALGLETFRDGGAKWNSDNGPVGTNYGLAMPQLYLEVFAPWANGLSIKLGHFYTIMGYEVVPAPENFFYSHAYTVQYGEPFTHTGLLAEYPLGERLKIQAGMTRGWDTWEDNNNGLGFLGGLVWTSQSERTSVALSVHTGPESAEPPPRGNYRTSYSLVLQQELTDRLTYVLQHDLGYEPRATPANRTAYWYGINQYLLYRINPTWAAGLRVEWFHDRVGARVFPGNGVDRGADYYELTAGLNWTPRERLIVRPELRWDWAKTSDPPLVDEMLDHQLLLAVDVIVTF